MSRLHAVGTLAVPSAATDPKGTRVALPPASTVEGVLLHSAEASMETNHSLPAEQQPVTVPGYNTDPPKPKTGLSFLSRLAEASPLTHSQPLDDDQLATFLPSKKNKGGVKDILDTVSDFKTAPGSETLERYQSFAATKDISVASERSLKRYQKGK